MNSDLSIFDAKNDLSISITQQFFTKKTIFILNICIAINSLHSVRPGYKILNISQPFFSVEAGDYVGRSVKCLVIICD